MKITTQHGYPPIPDRRFDWNAVDDETYDGPPSSIGYGPTERDAIEDLMRQIFENDTESFIQTMTDTHLRIIERDRQPPKMPRRLTDDEHDDDMFRRENGDGSIF